MAVGSLLVVGAAVTKLLLRANDRLDTWAKWVIPVGRLSFPTGPAVTRVIARPLGEQAEPG